ncbi:copper transporter [Kineosporiaceae bacterium SCSIO 59966]|nr:copper transporter [Kineosporiaceae bacterium SCSIO 59966]
MIDFRYHLVSLVSVFLALAIGVVLGAGPLRESIGDQLTNQVEALRQDKENLQLAVGNRDEQIRQRDQYVAATAPRLLAGQLTGRSVVVVALPSAGREAVDLLADELEVAGADVPGLVSVLSAWTDPGEQAFRRSLVGQLLPFVDPAPEAAGGTQGDLAAVLAWAVSAPADGAPDATAEAETAVEGLRSGGLVAVDGDVVQQADVVLVVTGAPPAGEDDEASAAAVEDSEPWLALLAEADARSAGAVLAGPVEAAGDTGLVGVVRQEGVPDGVSTSDAVDTPMGRVVAALALREQLAGGQGHYGVASGADAVVPEPVDLPAPADAGTEVPTDVPTDDPDDGTP